MALYQSRSARNCGLLGCNSSALTGGQNSGSSQYRRRNKISPKVIGCGSVSQTNRKSDGLHKGTRHTSCKSWYEFFDALMDLGNCDKLDQSTEAHYMAAENLADVKGYATSDLFVKHPRKDLWKM